MESYLIESTDWGKWINQYITLLLNKWDLLHRKQDKCKTQVPLHLIYAVNLNSVKEMDGIINEIS